MTALANALAESFVDSYKTELITERVWRSHAQVELATVEWVAWFNHERLHESLGDIPPVEFEQRYAAANALNLPISLDGSVARIPSRAANGLTTPLILPAGVLESRNGAHPQLLASTSSITTALAAANGGRRSAAALPPMDMTSCGQPEFRSLWASEG